MSGNFTMEEILARYPSCLHGNIEELVTEGIGLAGSLMQIHLPPNKLCDNYDIKYGNSLILNVPYIGKYLQWEIIFNDEDLTFPPDFDILNDTFLSDPDIDVIEKHLTALGEWDFDNPKSLISFIRQLFELYKRFQMEKFLDDVQHLLLREEFVQLKAKLGLKDGDVELFFDTSEQHFLVPLRLDCSGLPAYICKTYFPDGTIGNPGDDIAILKLSYYKHRKVPTLQLSPHLEEVLCTYTNFHLLPYGKDMTMLEYVESIRDLVEEKIGDIKTAFKLKEGYISVLLSLHGNNVREYDNIGFSRATFLFEVGSFACLGQIRLGERFPNEMPQVTLRSLYHKNADGLPASLVLKSYPYQPDWRVEEMVDKLLMHIRNEMNRFKSHCINNLSE